MEKPIKFQLNFIMALSASFFLSFTAMATELSKTISLKVAASSKIEIRGTSTMHDWESQATEVRGTGAFIIEGGKITGVNNVQITVPAKSINSGKNGMDKKTHEALKAGKAPNISFQLTEIKSVNNCAITAAGNLTIAGVTKPVTLSANYKLNGNEVTLTGSYKMNMSTFDIDPPTAMLGAIKTGDEITINYEILFQNP